MTLPNIFDYKENYKNSLKNSLINFLGSVAFSSAVFVSGQLAQQDDLWYMILPMLGTMAAGGAYLNRKFYLNCWKSTFENSCILESIASGPTWLITGFALAVAWPIHATGCLVAGVVHRFNGSHAEAVQSETQTTDVEAVARA